MHLKPIHHDDDVGIKQSELRQVLLPIPEYSSQRAIACILGALDDKIELNRRMNRTLETMARALFQSWFVDFDPVQAKLAGQAPAGLKPELPPALPSPPASTGEASSRLEAVSKGSRKGRFMVMGAVGSRFAKGIT